jgi:hypothetical protein
MDTYILSLRGVLLAGEILRAWAPHDLLKRLQVRGQGPQLCYNNNSQGVL